jgi:hypothetical protein
MKVIMHAALDNSCTMQHHFNIVRVKISFEALKTPSTVNDLICYIDGGNVTALPVCNNSIISWVGVRY